MRFSLGHTNADCQDNNGRIVMEGSHYIPGPDTCILCVCDNSVAKWCKAVLCSPPQVLLSNLYYVSKCVAYITQFLFNYRIVSRSLLEVHAVILTVLMVLSPITIQ